MTDLRRKFPRLAALEGWAFAAATVFIFLVIAGVVPRVSW
jgi:hypothetical protein